MPMVEHPTAKAGTIHGTDGKEVQPNQNIPMGKSTDSTQTKYSRPSAAADLKPKCAATRSW